MFDNKCLQNNNNKKDKYIILYHMAVQSKCTINHLEGLNANEETYSMPVSQCLYSGQIKAEPAYAASTCNHKFSFRPSKQK